MTKRTEKGGTMTAYCGVDFHTRQQTIAFCDTEDGEIKWTQLRHDDRESLQRFYSHFEVHL